MRFHVTGTNHSSGARMSLDLQAESKAAAQRKANNAGMDVQHIQPIDDYSAGSANGHSSHRGEDFDSGGGLWIKLAVIVAIMGVAGYFAWPMIRSLLHH